MVQYARERLRETNAVTVLQCLVAGRNKPCWLVFSLSVTASRTCKCICRSKVTFFIQNVPFPLSSLSQPIIQGDGIRRITLNVQTRSPCIDKLHLSPYPWDKFLAMEFLNKSRFGELVPNCVFMCFISVNFKLHNVETHMSLPQF